MTDVVFRLENCVAKHLSDIKHSVKITYSLYLMKDGKIHSKLGTDQSIDNLLKKNSRYIHEDREYIIRKIYQEKKEEPVFKLVQNNKKFIKKRKKKK